MSVVVKNAPNTVEQFIAKTIERYKSEFRTSPEDLLTEIEHEYLPLEMQSAEDAATAKKIKAGIAELKKIRTSIEKRRKELKATPLQVGKAIDAEAKRLTAIFQPTEETLASRIEDFLALEKAKKDQKAAEKEAAAQAKEAEIQKQKQRVQALVNRQFSFKLEDIEGLCDEDFSVILEEAETQYAEKHGEPYQEPVAVNTRIENYLDAPIHIIKAGKVVCIIPPSKTQLNSQILLVVKHESEFDVLPVQDLQTEVEANIDFSKPCVIPKEIANALRCEGNPNIFWVDERSYRSDADAYVVEALNRFVK